MTDAAVNYLLTDVEYTANPVFSFVFWVTLVLITAVLINMVWSDFNE